MIRQPLRGALGNQSGYAALQALEMMQASGTLLLEQPYTSSGEPASDDESRGTPRFWLGLCKNGQTQHIPLGEVLELHTPGLEFTFYAHRADVTSGAQTLPQFGSRFPDGAAALRALPRLGAQGLSAHDTDLRALVARLVFERFTGTLILLDAQGERGVMFFSGGRIGAASYEGGEGGDQQSGSGALRATLQLSDQHFAQPLKGGVGARLELRALPPPISSSLLGLAHEQIDGGERRNGVEVSSAGYTYLYAGRPYLFIAAHTAEPSGFYTALYSTPSLSLPSQPPGWEEQRYYLTLRGRDALNPMTELAMRFEREFGRTGRQTLSQLARRSSVADVARSLSVELSDLKPHVEKLEAESLIRKADR